MESYDYYCHYCGDGLTEDEVCYDDNGNECCDHCVNEQDYWYKDEDEDVDYA